MPVTASAATAPSAQPLTWYTKGLSCHLIFAIITKQIAVRASMFENTFRKNEMAVRTQPSTNPDAEI